MKELLATAPDELNLVIAAVGLLALACVHSMQMMMRQGAGALVMTVAWSRLMDLALVLITAALLWRWVRVGHGPFLTMHEVLLSGMWSLGCVWRAGTRMVPWLRGTATWVLLILTVMGLWALASDPRPTQLPTTFEMGIMWFHIGLGKVFLGCALVALGLAVVVMMRRNRRGETCFAALPDDVTLDAMAWRCMLLALVFDTLMLIAGAVWAQDAWGRFWAWDPLETWAFVTWAVLALAIHARLKWRIRPVHSAWMILAVFVIAFLTFYGVPFLTEVPHQGAM